MQTFINNETTSINEKRIMPWEKPVKGSRWWLILLLVVLAAGTYFRTVGIDWDDSHHLHPDERFLTMVSSAISPVDSFREYFDTTLSSLNPNNVGYGFYVYGTFPLFTVRYISELVNKTGYDNVYLVGRYVSAVSDILTVLLVFFIALRLYKDRRIAVLGAAFYSASVLAIQLSHYFTVDIFTNLFITLTIYFGIEVMTSPLEASLASSLAVWENMSRRFDRLKGGYQTLVSCLLFGAALGMAMASKVSAVPVAILLPAAMVIKYAALSKEERIQIFPIIFRDLISAAVTAFIVFRILQPFAFTGPGFLGMIPSERWLSTLKELSLQSNGNVDFPPALQWARRPFSFAWENMVVWGLGLPLGILAWSGFLWMGWRILKGEWRQHSLLWLWTFIYFLWQSSVFSRTMRYQIPVYPILAIFAAWALVELWRIKPKPKGRFVWQKWASGFIGLIVIASTFAWAFAFTRIYTRPVTRVEASEWIYENIPSAINVQYETHQGDAVSHPVSYRNGSVVTSEEPLVMAFTPERTGALTDIQFAHIARQQFTEDFTSLVISITTDIEGQQQVAVGAISSDFQSSNGGLGGEYTWHLEPAVHLDEDEIYYLNVSPSMPGFTFNLIGDISLKISSSQMNYVQSFPEVANLLKAGERYAVEFSPKYDGDLSSVFIPHIIDWTWNPDPKTLKLSITDIQGEDQPVSESILVSSFGMNGDFRGDGYTFTFEQPMQLKQDKSYYLQIDFISGDGAISLYGSRQVNESTWDDAIPLGIEGYPMAFDQRYGLYPSGLNFEMYWDDNEDKRERFVTNLNQGDYLFITSNRQWGTTTRVPERYPMTTFYYQNLLGCPEGEDLLWCYRVAQPGMFDGNLGYELVKVFQSDPNIGEFNINSQFAEEAFTVYDHPKVLIFKKTEQYDPDKVRRLFNNVDLSQVIHLIPGDAANYPGNLMLPENRLMEQRAGGTWSELFNRNAIFNQFPILGVALWYLVVMILGWVVFPMVRIGLRGLNDEGYAFSRLIGMLFLSLLTWWIGSAGIPVTRLSITLVIAFLVVINLAIYLSNREEIGLFWAEKKRLILTIETLFLIFFLIDLLIRIGNPDLWHPYKGGEKPMDFSYFNAVLKSTTFPPYDPWFAGGYINYYYYGFVIVGVLVKWLGIMPSIAYNLILPTLFAFVGIGAFSVGWNLFAQKENEEKWQIWGIDAKAFFAGVCAAVVLLLLGNLGVPRMIIEGWQKLVAPAGVILEDAAFFDKLSWTFKGFLQYLGGAKLPYRPGDWYWIPSRAIPGEPITEFPFFTFLYADLHAHMLALPITILVLGWALSVLKRSWKWVRNRGTLFSNLLSLLIGAVAIGALRPTNTWDFPTYLIFALVFLFYANFRYADVSWESISFLNSWQKRLLFALLAVIIVAGLTFTLYSPFDQWFGQGYSEIKQWEGDHTPLNSYLIHWGLPLYLVFSWLLWEIRDWMAKTPVSALQKLKPYRFAIYALLSLVVIAVVALMLTGIKIAWITLPLLVMAGVLLLRPDQTEEKRFVLFMMGTGLLLTLMVELIVLVGDIGRMNTVFKFYLQAWTLLTISGAAGFVWLLQPIAIEWPKRRQRIWQSLLYLLVGGAAMFTIMAGLDKVTDRMNEYTPQSLDGMTYMAYSSYPDQGVNMDLRQDYEAIHWMQDNIIGSPVIVEANIPEYRWGSRFTINTGLPSVVGWNWHQRQQRTVTASNVVQERVDATGYFYNTSNRIDTLEYLDKYDVKYIVVGQLEKAYYNAAGIAKFEEMNGELWDVVYQSGDTTIYQVR
jgi:YYY domain-containing protein